MDHASIAPKLNCDPGSHYFRDLRNLRDQLRCQLSTAYSLQEFDLYFVPSVTFGLLTLAYALVSGGRQCALADGMHSRVRQ
jgi:hypothetical protein